MKPRWKIELITKQHKRTGFNCGEKDLDDYLRRYARQNTQSGISRTFVAVSRETELVDGYYSLASGSIKFENFPQQIHARFPNYPIPAVHLARLAVSAALQGKGLGSILLFDDLKRAALVASQVGVVAVTVDALSEPAKRYYERFGFLRLADNDLHLYLLIDTIMPLLDMDG